MVLARNSDWSAGPWLAAAAVMPAADPRMSMVDGSLVAVPSLSLETQHRCNYGSETSQVGRLRVGH